MSDTAPETIVPQAADPSFHGHAARFVNQGIALHQQGKVLEAEPLYRNALDLVQDQPDALHMLAVVSSQKGDQIEAERLVRRALQVLPNHTAYHNTLGRVLLLQGRAEEGLAALERSLELAPQNPEAHFNVGDAMLGQGKAREAEARFRRALQFKPTHAMAAFGLGRALWAQGDAPGALPWFQLAHLFAPADLNILNQLAVAYMALGHRDDALKTFETLLAAAPNSPVVQCNVGVLNGHANRIKAIEHYRKALTLDPTMSPAQDGYIEIARQLCLWDDFLDRTIGDALAGVRQRLAEGRGAEFRAFTALYLPFTPEEQLAVARSESAKLAQDVGDPLHGPSALCEGRLRIGYISADARNHPVGHLLQDMFRHHDRSRFEVFFYSTGVDDGSIQRRAIQSTVEHFVEARGTTSAELAQRIAADGVQVLVDLMGHTADSRMAVLARRPAPVQIHYLGFPGSTGAPFVDYLIADPVILQAVKGDLTGSAAITASSLDLQAQAGSINYVGALTAPSVYVDAATGAVALGAVNMGTVGTLQAYAGNGNVTMNGAVTAPSVQLGATGGSVLINNNISATGLVRVNADNQIMVYGNVNAGTAGVVQLVTNDVWTGAYNLGVVIMPSGGVSADIVDVAVAQSQGYAGNMLQYGTLSAVDMLPRGFTFTGNSYYQGAGAVINTPIAAFDYGHATSGGAIAGGIVYGSANPQPSNAFFNAVVVGGSNVPATGGVALTVTPNNLGGAMQNVNLMGIGNTTLSTAPAVGALFGSTGSTVINTGFVPSNLFIRAQGGNLTLAGNSGSDFYWPGLVYASTVQSGKVSTVDTTKTITLGGSLSNALPYQATGGAGMYLMTGKVVAPTTASLTVNTNSNINVLSPLQVAGMNLYTASAPTGLVLNYDATLPTANVVSYTPPAN